MWPIAISEWLCCKLLQCRMGSSKFWNIIFLLLSLDYNWTQLLSWQLTMNYQWSCAIVCEWASERGRVREWCHHYIAFRGHVLLMHCLCCLYIVVYACCLDCRAIPHIMHIDEYMLCITSSEYPQCCTQQPAFLLQSDSCRSHCQAQGLASTGEMAVAVDWGGGCSWLVRTIGGRKFLQTVLALRKQLVHGERFCHVRRM